MSKRLADVGTWRSGGTPPKDRTELWDGGFPWISTRDLKQPELDGSTETITELAASRFSTTVPAGSLLIATRGMALAKRLPAGMTTRPVAFNQDIKAIEPHRGVWPKYLLYALLAFESAILALTDEAAHGTKRLDTDLLRAFRIPCPSLAEQRAIADFLDAETARIDALIGARERQSHLLAERATAVASALSLRGTRAGVSFKPSGVAPLSDIPGHWRTLRNKVFLREIADLSAEGSEELLTVSHLTGVTTRAEKTEVTMLRADSTVGYKRCAPGDLVINTMWAWMGALGVARQHGIVSPAYGVYRFDLGVADPFYFEHVFRSPPYVAEMTRFSRGVWTSRLRLYPETFLALSAPVPPLPEQRSIVDRIDAQTGRDINVSTDLRRSIALLRERRQALIAAAVTGKLQVPSTANPNAAA